MPALPDSVKQAWEDRKGPVVFSTVSFSGQPNAIYASCVSRFDEDTIIVADNYFDKTKKNIDSGSPGSVLFLTNEDKSFQIKGRIEYHSEGPLFENMKSWNPERLPGHRAAALKVEEVYKGAEKIL